MAGALGKDLLTIVTDWRIDESGGRQYGICMVEVPPPQDYLSFKRGFPLTNPGHVRCAIFSLRLGLEVCLGTERVADKGYARVLREFFAVLITRSQIVYDLFRGTRAEKIRRWSDDTSVKPVSMHGYNKVFMRQMFTLLDELRDNSYGDVVCVPPEEGEEDSSILLKHKVNLDIDPEKDYAKTEDRGATEKRIDDMRQRQYLRSELMEIGGCRSSRARRRMTKKEKQAIVKKDDARVVKQDDGAGEPTPAGAGASKNPAAAGTGSTRTAQATITSATGAAAAGAGSVGADAQRATPAVVSAAPADGPERAASGDADSHVQVAEHGAVGGEQPVEVRAGNQ